MAEGWMDTIGKVGRTVGAKTAEGASDWLDRSLGLNAEEEAAREVRRFRQGPARAYMQGRRVETDQNVGAQPYDPRTHNVGKGGGGSDGTATAGMAGGMGDLLTSPLGMLLLVGTAVGLYYNATN